MNPEQGGRVRAALDDHATETALRFSINHVRLPRTSIVPAPLSPLEHPPLTT